VGELDNSRDSLFNPAVKLTSKPFATSRVLEKSIELQTNTPLPPSLAAHLSSKLDVKTLPMEFYRNPYEEEIKVSSSIDV
jgi:hypothetical protein